MGLFNPNQLIKWDSHLEEFFLSFETVLSFYRGKEEGEDLCVPSKKTINDTLGPTRKPPFCVFSSPSSV